MIERITSAQNPKIKHLLALQEKSRLRREEGLFVVEGRRELEHCLAAGFQLDTLFLCPEIAGPDLPGLDPAGPDPAGPDLPGLNPAGLAPAGLAPAGLVPAGLDPTGPDLPGLNPAGLDLTAGPDPAGPDLPGLDPAGLDLTAGLDLPGLNPAGSPQPPSDVSLRSTPPFTPFTVPPLPMPRAARSSGGKGLPARIVHVSKEVYAKVAYREGTEGVIAEVRWKERTLADLLPKGHAPLIMVLESVEKPGNLGAVLRSADAAGADGVILCNPLTDLYNPNLIRASIGAVFTVPVVACTSDEAIAWLKENNIRILTAQLQDSAPYYDVDMTCGTALVMGTEATGLTDAWRQAADAHILIPMLGRLDSLNVSVSAAILLYEAVRQRQR